MDPQQLPSYKYYPLQDAGQDIRIVEVLPGHFHDNLRVRIHHAPLVEPPDVADTRMTILQLQETLPTDWEVFSTPEGKYLFRFWVGKVPEFSWEHPDPSVDKAAYELPTYHDELDPHYEALSYVWGSDQTPHHLTVEGEQGCTQIAVTDGLMSALRYLRRPNKPRRLWVDAVCINQDDPVEVASQVRRMGVVYKLAYRVVVWLGPESEGSGHALATLDLIGAQIEIDSDDDSLCAAPSAQYPSWWLPLEEFTWTRHASPPTWHAVTELLRRPWFTRVWTVQEIQLGNRQPGPIFQCGMETIGHYRLYRAVHCVENILRYFAPASVFSPHLANAYMVLNPMVNHGFSQVLRRAVIGRQCKDGRDKIYGTLSLLPKRFASKIQVDYGTSNTASQVYKSAFLTHAQHVERLELFTNCFGSRRTIPGAPSWVPDWGSHTAASSPHNRQFATSTSRAHFRYSDEEPDLLEVLGMSCVIVSHVEGPIPKGLDWRDAMDRVKQRQPRDLDTATYKPTGEPLRKAYACTLIEDYVKDRFHGTPYPTMEQWVEQAGDCTLFGDFSPPGEWGDEMKMRAATHRAVVFCENYAFIQTHEGYIGLAPPETMPGDVVAILLGCSNPVVLRPEKAGYSVVGESFIYGLGDAIKLLGPLPEPWRVTAKTSGLETVNFYLDPQTMETSWEDPRLEPLHGWVRLDREPNGDDPIDFAFFEHQETGIVVNYDPRLEPEMLEKRGVQLEWFTLV